MIETIPTNIIRPKGLLTVELFDDLTGKKVEELKGENFISQGVLKNLFNARMTDVFTNSRATGGYLPSKFMPDPFYTIALTDATHAESPLTEVWRKGRLIGYADTRATYSGTDAKKGGYNASESFTKHDQVHMVFDFPTNASNGTFQSIYFTPNMGTDNNSPVYDMANFKILDEYFPSIQKYNGKFYCLNGTTFKRLDANYQIEQTWTLPVAANDFVIANDFIYTTTTSGKIIHKAPVADPLSRTVVLSSDTTISYYYGIAFDEVNQRFYVACDNTSPAADSIRIYDANFVYINATTVSALCPLFWNDGIFLGAKQFMLNEYLETSPITLDAIYSVFCGVDENSIYLAYYTSTKTYRIPKAYIGSRCLLESPITKTSTNTMKITYDFMLPGIWS